MISELLRSLEGFSSEYSLVGLLLFFSIFIVMSVRAWKMDKKKVEHISTLPLDSSDAVTKRREK